MVEVAGERFITLVGSLAGFYQRAQASNPYVLVRAKDGRLELVGHVGNAWLVCDTGAPCSWSRPLLVALAPLQALVAPNTVSEGPITLGKTNGTWLRVDVGSRSCALQSRDPERFPETEWDRECGWGAPTTVQWVDRALSFLSEAMCRDPRQPRLQVLHLTKRLLVATDGHRLHAAELQSDVAEELLGARDEVLVSPGVVYAGERLSMEPHELTLGSQYLRIQGKASGRTVYARLVTGQTFPNWERVLPGKGWALTVPQRDLRRALEALVEREAAVEVSFDGHGLVLEQPVDGEGRRVVVEAHGEGLFPGTYAFNPNYLLESLAWGGSGPVQLQGDTVDAAIRIQITGAPAWAVVMPMRR